MALAVACAASALAVAGAWPDPAAAASCKGTLRPVAGGEANAAGYSFSCDVAIEGAYGLDASNSAGEPLDVVVRKAGQGFDCTPEAEEEEVEEPGGGGEGEEGEGFDLSSWQCDGGRVAPGTALDGELVAEADPCAAPLDLMVTAYRRNGAKLQPAARGLLSIDCVQPEPSPGAAPPPASAPSGAPQPAAPAAPAVSDVRVWPSRFAARHRSKRSRTPLGATVGYRLSARARVTFVVQRVLAGVRAGGRCVAPKAGARKRGRAKSACTRYLGAGPAILRNGAAGANRFRFEGRLGGKALAPGVYRLLARARSATGALGAIARSARFRVVR